MFSFKPVAFYTLLTFLAVQALAIVVGFVYTQAGVSVMEGGEAVENAFYLFGYVVATALVLLLILKYYQGKLLFLLLELVLTFIAVMMVTATTVDNEWAILSFGLLAVLARLLVPPSRAVLMLITSAAVGALLGSSLGVLAAAVLAVLLSAYDYYAVFISKHMVKLADQLESRHAAFSITVRAQKQALHLGTGDLVIPAALSVSALKIAPYPLNLVAAAATAIGGASGLTILLYLMEKRAGVWPALPPIAALALAGLGLFVLLAGG